jgi:replicative DNA helicase
MQQTDSVPYDFNLELTLIALILADNTVIDRVDRLEGDHFYDLAHREVFLAARDLRAEHQRVNLVTLSGRMGGDPLGGNATALDSLQKFSFNGQTPDPYDVVRGLIGLHAARQMQAIGQRLADSVWNYGTKRSDVMEAAMRELDALLASERPQKQTSWDLEAGMDDMLCGLDVDGIRTEPAPSADLLRIRGAIVYAVASLFL